MRNNILVERIFIFKEMKKTESGGNHLYLGRALYDKLYFMPF